MRHLLILALSLLFLSSCEKDGINVTECEKKMRNHFKDQLNCKEKGSYESNLYKGTYDGKTIYFTNIVCISCLTMPPNEGYTCDMEKVKIENFNDVKDIKMVYNSCTKNFIK
ncbi:hypothetical protein [Sphingobacterium cellulitidis]|uniref:hypothetical protein n=1 Tax=Sphingobacterium cellulitidis TaxID=1768011 RepID=UPI000B943071|nr:hypothetical protein [Sphingobacterium cellulitidis]OYD42414.1 hypothetical protein CHT99_06175 [Sphingobacterium cellulitidis]OYD45257.1 hypothetical protein CHU00_12625 [Sphingobacterium cellulitidis]